MIRSYLADGACWLNMYVLMYLFFKVVFYKVWKALMHWSESASPKGISKLWWPPGRQWMYLCSLTLWFSFCTSWNDVNLIFFYVANFEVPYFLYARCKPTFEVNFWQPCK